MLFPRVQINAIFKKEEEEEEECGKVRAGLYIGWSRVYFPRRCYLCAANGWELARLARPCGNGSPVSIEEFTLIVASIFRYIFCNFDTVELQKMYEKIKVSPRTDRGLLCTADLVYCFFELVSYSFQRESLKYMNSGGINWL